ncbi:MAG: hypothetical protein IH963_03595, partial [Chloroflexi bacterium]|nr:hypothetical protein [Chloroflexota bacterium]
MTQSVVLMMRIIYVAIDLANGYVYAGNRAYGFGPEGLWSLGFLCAACVTALVSTGDRRLGTCQIWCTVTLVTWACLLAPPLRHLPTGGYERTGATLVLLLALASLLMAVILISGWADRRSGLSTPDTSHSGQADTAASAPTWPGLPLSAAMLAITVILLSCYHLLVPVVIGQRGFLLSAAIVSVSGALAAWACFVLFLRTGTAYLAEVAMGLASFSICGLATLAVPSAPVILAERYPMIFNAIIVGLAAATGLWAWLASDQGRRRILGRVRGGADRLTSEFKRFAFLSAALALLVVGTAAQDEPIKIGVVDLDQAI